MIRLLLHPIKSITFFLFLTKVFFQQRDEAKTMIRLIPKKKNRATLGLRAQIIVFFCFFTVVSRDFTLASTPMLER